MHSSDFFELIRSAGLGAVQAALAEDPQLATAKAESQRVPNGESERWTPLHAAIEARSLGIARALVQAGADLEARTERERESRTPLHDSIELGQPKITELPLASGAYVDMASAAILGRLDRVRELLDADSALANDLSTGLSPLGWASYGNQPEVARELIRRGARLDDSALACAPRAATSPSPASCSRAATTSTTAQAPRGARRSTPPPPCGTPATRAGS